MFSFDYPGHGWLYLAKGMVYNDGNDDRPRTSPLMSGLPEQSNMVEHE